MSKKNDSLSKFISLILRHKPEVVGLNLDTHGYIEVKKLIEAINEKSDYRISLDILKDIVKTDNKQRYSFNKDNTLIRANQGHSIKVDVELKEVVPPEYLFHGTAKRFINSIFQKGIVKGNRLYVHLSKDMETAIKVGKRHGEVAVLTIDAKAMYEKGYKFYLSQNGVYLCDYIPQEYIISIK